MASFNYLNKAGLAHFYEKLQQVFIKRGDLYDAADAAQDAAQAAKEATDAAQLANAAADQVNSFMSVFVDNIDENDGVNVGNLVHIATQAQEAIDGLHGVQVTTTTPYNESTEVWVNPDETTSYAIPEINDATTSTDDTWSSQKIASEIGLVAAQLSDLTGMIGLEEMTNDYIDGLLT